MRILFAALVAFIATHPALAADDKQLVGTWKLTRWVMEDVESKEQKPSPFGEHPAGYVVFTPSERLFVLITAEDRKAPEDADGQGAAFRTMYAYSGKYRIENDKFITKVDAAGDKRWVGTEQSRIFRIDGGKLIIETHPTKQGERSVRSVLVWDKE